MNYIARQIGFRLHLAQHRPRKRLPSETIWSKTTYLQNVVVACGPVKLDTTSPAYRRETCNCIQIPDVRSSLKQPCHCGSSAASAVERSSLLGQLLAVGMYFSDCLDDVIHVAPLGQQ